MHILLVEDDKKAARLLAQGLQEEGFEVVVAHSGEEALAHLGSAFDVAIFDRMLPGIDGLTLCQRVRQAQVQWPILMLTARDALGEKVEGLHAGVDDYLAKPFAFEELLARLHALLRRPSQLQVMHLQLADLRIDLLAHEVLRDGQRLDLTQKEYAVLVLLVRHAGNVVSRQQLAEQVWHADLIAIDNLIDVHIKNLRRKIDTEGRPAMIETLRGQGFCIRRQGQQ
ncbi:PhoB family transcriptional regulator [Herbaspirillum rubrisubalbicans]|uniref:PhoB family transcriptional regulator n=2 Tax=Herbaspirillum rubrisubalbicans TaxID=80842 RepID=A0ABX9BYC0_9BURK|nr:response regulator transcription factor [Herbaspirillum rubrisubalbicans]MCP1572407.1 DNA-binding response OmpR family regulator [Herbaspirillum rubrisubalbicans]NQE50634.1 PhoB family transcriptional regulator [Herbaspirillum rubrisubalbicans]QJQ01041.1 DNA-binding response regulator [Herbaspirillum rubrisubalbicans Os34]RAM62808.1 PhoB family transcriptional regulator [Herbaspirillum rubrisubalbicans]RAN49304.1 PhoB family transcriptional regulator [Herbaspirillum rubrisubalbicans]